MIILVVILFIIFLWIFSFFAKQENVFLMLFHRVLACYTAFYVTTASILNWYYATEYLFYTCNIAASSNSAISLNTMYRLFVIYDCLSSVVEPKCGTVDNDKPSLLRIFIYFYLCILFKSCYFVILSKLTACLYVLITIIC